MINNLYSVLLGDYASETAEMSLAEHGAYRLLLDWHYCQDKPLPLDLERVFNICKAVSIEEREAVSYALNKFFTKTDDGFVNVKATNRLICAFKTRIRFKRADPRSGLEWLRLRRVVFRRDNYTCVYCGATADLQCDHVIPVSQGGLTIKSNLTTACKTCNRNKGGRTPAQWRAVKNG